VQAVGGVSEDSHHHDTVQSLQYEIELLKTRISQEREKLKVLYTLLDFFLLFTLQDGDLADN
jgi:hypothetical protein